MGKQETTTGEDLDTQQALWTRRKWLGMEVTGTEPSVDTLAECGRRWLGQQSRIIAACALFGAVYGAMLGAMVMPRIMAHLVHIDPEGGPPGGYILNSGDVVAGATYGAVLGAFGGGGTGFIRLATGGAVRWSLAAFVTSIPLALLTLLAEPFSGLIIAPVGLFLGCALTSALRSGRLVVLGVAQLAAIINDGQPPSDDATRGETATEVAHAAAPAGRGDEPSPAPLKAPRARELG